MKWKSKYTLYAETITPPPPSPPPQKKILEVKQGYKNANEAVKKGS